MSASVSTHVLDAVAGRPAAGIAVRLEDAAGTVLGRARTDADGRVAALATPVAPGIHRLIFDVGAYLGPDAFFPEVVLTFRIVDVAARHHVPLLLSPYSYTTYRGS
jgi:5-hydroxyisourate hydrolase